MRVLDFAPLNRAAKVTRMTHDEWHAEFVAIIGTKNKRRRALEIAAKCRELWIKVEQDTMDRPGPGAMGAVAGWASVVLKDAGHKDEALAVLEKQAEFLRATHRSNAQALASHLGILACDYFEARQDDKGLACLREALAALNVAGENPSAPGHTFVRWAMRSAELADIERMGRASGVIYKGEFPPGSRWNPRKKRPKKPGRLDLDLGDGGDAADQDGGKNT
ncbi:hypothetical protein DB346_01130 [Verrucomicrobia bacterium LW23]|nr:hypothetical protein DB346_01130 [Verrucomicrobia bacterium LW23]